MCYDTIEMGERAQREPDRGAYKQSAYADIIDLTLVLVESEREDMGRVPDSLRKLAEWAEWMIQGGFCLPPDKVAEGTRKILEMTVEEEEELNRGMRKILAEYGVDLSGLENH